MTLDIYITGANQAQCEERYWDVRGLLDQEDECELKLDRFNDRYWMAKFDSLSPLTFVGKNVVSATLIFTMHDRAAYANTESSETVVLNETESADYGDDVRGICHDSEFVYCCGITTKKVWKLSLKDLTKIAESSAFVGDLYAICCDDDYIYTAGADNTPYKLLKTTLALVATGPDYGGDVYCICCDNDAAGYIYYGGNGGAGQYDACKLLKSNMTTIVRSPDYGGIIYAICLDDIDTYVYYGGDGGAGQYDIDQLDIATMAAETRGSTYAAIIRGLAVDATYVYGCGDFDNIQRIDVATMAVVTLSADLGTDLNCITIDDDYIYTAGDDNYIYKLDKAFTTGETYISSQYPNSYGDDIYAINIDAANNALYIGGKDIKTVWKVDSRHLSLCAESTTKFGTYFLAMCCDADYVYVAGYQATYQYVWKLRKSDLTVIKKSPAYGGAIRAVACQQDPNGYVYCGGETVQKVWRLSKGDLSFIEESADYTAMITTICVSQSDAYVYWAGADGAASVVNRSPYNSLTIAATSAAYGGDVTDVVEDGTYVYCGGGTVNRIFQLNRLTLAKNWQSDNAYGGTIFCIASDGWGYVYCGGSVDTIMQVDITDQSTFGTSADLGGDRYAIEVDDDYVYTVGLDGYCQKLYYATLAIVAKYALDSATNYFLAMGNGYIYAMGYHLTPLPATASAIRLDKRHLWRRWDNEVTLTTSGTARSNPVISISATIYALYWEQGILNEGLNQEFNWRGDVETTPEVLEVDSELWYVTLDGVSAMSGASGDFVQISEVAPTLYFQDIAGTVTITWSDRFA
jgi:hypothetical protein